MAASGNNLSHPRHILRLIKKRFSVKLTPKFCKIKYFSKSHVLHQKTTNLQTMNCKKRVHLQSHLNHHGNIKYKPCKVQHFSSSDGNCNSKNTEVDQQ